MLREWLGSPLVDLAPIHARHDAVEGLIQGALRRSVRETLRRVGDLERLSGKAAQGTASARDLVALASSLRALPEMVARLEGVEPLLARCPEDLVEDVFNHLYDKTRAALLDDFRIYAHIHKRRALSLSDVKEFTYWLHKRRLNIWDPARVASDTRKGTDRLRKLEEIRAPAPNEG